MNQQLKDLFYSNNEEDIKLALIIARKENVDPKEINDLHDDFKCRFRNLYGDYLRSTFPGYKATHAWDYTEWKQEKEI